MQPSSDIFKQFLQFLKELVQSMGNGLLFFGGPLDLLATLGDVIATTVVVYYVLRLLRNSRAWQLLKGLLLIFVFAIVASILDFNTISFLLNNTISLLAIAIVVLFQPELRRALETVGRSKFNVLNTPRIVTVVKDEATETENMIMSIVDACDYMSQRCIGALMIIERQTALSELAQQENAVLLDAELSTTMLRQIFYLGSPLHDGAVLIQDGRIAAARIHVPLADTTSVRTDFGTRHRAAMGASEIGDTIAIVVSEERGTISLAISGRLIVMDDIGALEQALRQELVHPTDRKGLRRFLTNKSLFGIKLQCDEVVEAEIIEPEVLLPLSRAANQEEISTNGVSSQSYLDHADGHDHIVRRVASGETNEEGLRLLWHRLLKFFFEHKRVRHGIKHRASLVAMSLLISVSLWLYIQVTINPIAERNFTVAITYSNETAFQEKGLRAVYPIEKVSVTLKARRRVLDRLSPSDVSANIDMSKITTVGQQKVKIDVKVNTPFYTNADNLNPDQVAISVRNATP